MARRPAESGSWVVKWFCADTDTDTHTNTQLVPIIPVYLCAKVSTLSLSLSGVDTMVDISQPIEREQICS